MNTIKEKLLLNATAFIVDDNWICYPAETDEGDIEICQDFGNEDTYVFDDTSFENISVPSKGTIRLTSTCGVEFDLTPLTTFNFNTPNEI